MSPLAAVARLHATEAGRAERLTTVRHEHLEERPFVLVPLTLAGEACAPLAALAGTDPDHPVLLTVRQPRDRAERFRFVERLAGLLLPYIEACRTAETDTYTAGRGKEKEERRRFLRAPQLLVPNGEGIAYVRLLGRLTRMRAVEGPHAVDPSVPALGKWLTWFADRAEFPGSCLLQAATRLLAANWATGQSPSEDSHLASLLAWIDPPPGRNGAEAARETEDPTRWPPAGPATDPVFDRTLIELMSRYDEAQGRGREAAGRQIDRELEAQMLPTWQLVWRGVDLLRALPAGEHVTERWAYDRRLFTEYAAYLDDDGRPQARRDHAVGAARRLARLEEATARYDAQRAYDDPLVMAEYELAGEAFTGEVVARDEDRFVPGTRPGSTLWRPAVTVRSELPVRLAAGKEVKSPARPGQKAEIVEVLPDGDAHLVVVQLNGGFGKRKPPAPPGTLAEVGETVIYTSADPKAMPSVLPDDEDTPWTHGGPPQPYEPTEDDAEESWE
ncbi:hypothetical protein ACSNOH_12430 [Streptomyces sp. URMC 127]|uniref:hypothetical protein n=1 Tax=Streptomyces sp. URMC 127 TaxID=3423402 RepID=UPI003F19CB06